MEFIEFPKMARLSREIIVTEKIDGTNAQIFIGENGEFLTGSRTRWITPQDDNFGFSAWANQNKNELLKLGTGRHFGEWWGGKIQRGYGVECKRFSLFNSSRWNDDNKPDCCLVVPVLYSGIFSEQEILKCLKLLEIGGSVAAPGFMNPEGVVIYHAAAGFGFKKTIHKDETPKSLKGY
jgi:hypothetical protein